MKFNNSLLYEEEFLKVIKTVIENVTKQYAVPVYYYNIGLVKDEDIAFSISDQLFLKNLLMEIRGKCISYSSFKKKSRQQKEQVLINEIKTLEECEHAFTNTELESLDEKKKALETIRKHRMAGAHIRSKARWVEEGEKPSHYFCSLESRNFLNKVIPRIEKENGDVISNQFEINKKNYFKNLYRNIDDTIRNVNLEKEISN